MEIKALDDGQIDAVWDNLDGTSWVVNTTDQRRFARAVEAAIKATSRNPQPILEPNMKQVSPEPDEAYSLAFQKALDQVFATIDGAAQPPRIMGHFGPELECPLPITMHEPEMPTPHATPASCGLRGWDEFCKFRAHRASDPLNFFGCVDKTGFWFASSHGFGLAAARCAAAHAPVEHNDLTEEQVVDWMRDEGVRLGLSIIHGSMIKRMYEAGLIS